MRSFRFVEICITGADIWESLQLLNEHAVDIVNVRETEPLTVCVDIPESAWSKAEALLTRRGDVVRILKISVQKRFLHMLKRRWALVSGVLILLFVNCYLPTKVLVIEVTGNETVQTRQILEASAQAGVRFFTTRKDIRSEKIKNELLTRVPQLQWAGVNTYGSRAVISVKEKSSSLLVPSQEHTVSNIVAACDGVIRSVTVNNGTIRCAEGQAVRKGQLLISGYTDCGLTIRAGRADGEVFAETIRQITAAAPGTALVKSASKPSQKQYSIVLGKKRIFLWKDSGICYSSCDRINKEYTLMLPGGYALPISFCTETIIPYELMQDKVVAADTARNLEQFAADYLQTQMIAGKILGENVSLSDSGDVYLLVGEYVCREMIGRERAEKIGDLYEQND